MGNEGLAELSAAFAEWRSKKRHMREATPSELLKRARAEARRYGPAEVARATGVDRSRLKTEGRARRRPETPMGSAGYSRVTLAAPGGGAQPFAEIEGLTGVKVRLFMPSGEVLGVLSSLLGVGGAR
jgi:hypothetical protein